MIYFRCDGNKAIGGGHVMRCLSIAKAFQKNNFNCSFILSDNEFAHIVNAQGFKTIVLNSKYNDMSEEIDRIMNVIDCKDSLVIIDSYFVSYNYLAQLRKNIKVVYIDDLFSFAYPVDLIVNYNIYADKERYRKLYSASSDNPPKLILGTNYAPLRDEFCNAPRKEINQTIRNVLVLTGASDSLHVTIKLIEEIINSNVPYLFHFVVGEKNQDYSRISSVVKSSNNVFIHHKCNYINELMQKCDVALSAAGSTLYELSSIGTPIIGFITADNQIEGITEFEKRNLLINLGDARLSRINLTNLKSALQIISERSVRENYSRKLRSIVDGNGANRIADKLIDFFNL